MPSGLFNEHTTICEQKEIFTTDQLCDPGLDALSDRLPMPQGYASSMGSYLTCLSVTEMKTQFCPLRMRTDFIDVGEGVQLSSNESYKYPRGAAYWVTDMMDHVNEVLKWFLPASKTPVHK